MKKYLSLSAGIREPDQALHLPVQKSSDRLKSISVLCLEEIL